MTQDIAYHLKTLNVIYQWLIFVYFTNVANHLAYRLVHNDKQSRELHGRVLLYLPHLTIYDCIIWLLYVTDNHPCRCQRRTGWWGLLRVQPHPLKFKKKQFIYGTVMITRRVMRKKLIH